MRFTIITNKQGHYPPQRLCDFFPPGGTIGRGSDNNLVLPDDERIISRLQAIVHITALGECRVTNRGTVTRVVLNDIPLERGRQVELQDGDILGIDDYRLQISQLPADNSVTAQAGCPTGARVPPGQTTLCNTSGETAVSEPFATQQTAVPHQIWDDLLQEFSINAAGKCHPQSLPMADDIDPLYGRPEPVVYATQPEASHSALSHFAPRTPATDDLFSQQDLFAQPGIFADASPSALLNTQMPQQNYVDERDPLALFAVPTMLQEDSQTLSGLINGASPAVEPLPASASPLPAHEVITLPTPQAIVAQPTVAPKGRLRIDPVANVIAEPPAASGELLQGELYRALINGIGLSDMHPAARFDAQNMEQLGQMLSLFSQGTVALLSSRSILKRGVKAEMTVILDEANNPFKLLPSGKTVLMQMFGSRMPGFMSPKQAVRDALIDLQAHQLGMIAGIRAIIASMLQCFNPEQLQEEARQQKAASRLSWPGSRKAAVWEHFIRRYQQTAGEIEDDFHTLFGEAFLHAYDMEVSQYKDSQSRAEQ